ncbi:hypothetical protein QM716_00680 [Rhodococcus sp. IEGM 1409]|nr:MULTISPECIES: hypothetical protein [Rhodococcus]MDI9898362.1 hypothetical protein [Rhodococcus sp. IEGM 1409]MDV6276184.1 hypothetical protein [Rhodococcus erythropolis]
MGSMEGILGAVVQGLGSLFSADGLLKTFMGSVEGISKDPTP